MFKFITKNNPRFKSLCIVTVIMIAITIGVIVGFLVFGNEKDTFNSIEQLPTSFSVYGTITKDGNPAVGAEVSVMYGNKTVCEAVTTDINGSYVCRNLKNAVYNIIVKYEDSELTEAVTVSSQDAVLDMDFPEYPVSCKIAYENQNSPAIIIGNLKNEAIAQGKNGDNVGLIMHAGLIDSPEEKMVEQIESVSGELQLTYFDFKLEKNTPSAETQQITETQNTIEIIIEYDTSHDIDTRVFRYNNGQAELFEATQNPGSEQNDATFFIDGKYLHIYMNKLSAIAIGSAKYRDNNTVKIHTPIKYDKYATLHLSTGVIEVGYYHTEEANSNVRVNLYLTLNTESTDDDILLSKSEVITPGNKLVLLKLENKDIKKRLSAGDYSAKFTVEIIREDGVVVTNADCNLILKVVD